MNTKEFVMLNTDTNYIHTKFAVIDTNIGTDLASSYAWIKCVSYGCTTKEKLEAFDRTSKGYAAELGENGQWVAPEFHVTPDKSGIVGTLNEYQVVSLVDIVPFKRGGKITFESNIPLG